MLVFERELFVLKKKEFTTQTVFDACEIGPNDLRPGWMRL